MFLISPGFYELSDGGSCSLSNSCTSVYSECLSSSQTSLLLRPMSPANSHINSSSQVDVCRRRSADESTTQPNPPRATGLHLGSSRIRASTEQARPRPVSTGNHTFQSLISLMLYWKAFNYLTQHVFCCIITCIYSVNECFKRLIHIFVLPIRWSR